MNTPLVTSTARYADDGARATLAPVIVAPMYRLSGPELVVASCRAGLVGSFPARNAGANLAEWFAAIEAGLRGLSDPRWAVSVISHRCYARLDEELELLGRYRPPLVITALGSPRRVVDVVRGYGGSVFAEVDRAEYGLRAMDAGAEGLVVSVADTRSQLVLVDEVRGFFGGPLVLAAGISSGRGVRAAEVLGARWCYLGARFGHSAEALPGGVAAAGSGHVDRDAELYGIPRSWLAEGPGSIDRDAGARRPLAEVAAEVDAEYRAAAAGEQPR